MNRPHTLFVSLLAAFAAGGASAQTPAFFNFNSLEYQEVISSAGKPEPQPLASPNGDQTVSVSALRHKIPGKAREFFSRALKFARAGQWQKGAEEMQKAVAIDPDFSDAHSNLGADYIALRRFREAIAELRRAIALDPGVSAYHSNIALAYLLLRQTGVAKAEAETAVQLDGRNTRGQYLLGLVLSKNPQDRHEAQRHLAFAAIEIPEAHLVLESLYRSNGEESKAKLELERYQKASSSEQER